MGTQTGLITVEDFLKWKDPKEDHYELHHREVVLMPPPKWGHVLVQKRVHGLIERFVCNKRAQRVGSDDYLSGAPDLVVEVLSPGNTMYEINDKMAVCMANGCSSFWTVDPKSSRLSVTEADVTRHYRLDATFQCGLIGANVPVREIFD